MKELQKQKQIVEVLISEGITTSRGTEISTQSFKQMVEAGKIPYYHIPNSKIKYFDEDMVMQYFRPTTEDYNYDGMDDFKKMIKEAEELGIQFPQFIKAKEVYETYLMKKFDNEIKQREHIPVIEIKALLEKLVGELKAELYNIPNKLNREGIESEITDKVYTHIDNAFAKVFYKIENVEDNLNKGAA